MSTSRKKLNESAEEVIDELIDELLEEQKKVEKINNKIMKHEIIERLNIKELKLEKH